MATTQSFGEALPDQFERLTNYFDVQLQVLGDVRELYQSRVALEREYGTKLNALTRKALDKKVASEKALVSGPEPNKAWNDGLLQQHTLSVAYTELIDSFMSAGQDHVNLADTFSTQVVDVLKGVEKRSEETKKKELDFFHKLLAERERVYGDRKKCKDKYDAECQQAETARQKQVQQGRAQDDRHADRAAKHADQERNEMLNSKNAYLISIAIANGVKDHFFSTSMPELENEFQRLQTRLVQRFVKILQHSQKVELSHLEAIKYHVNRVEGALERVDVAKDQELFIQYNSGRQFAVPSDWAFEPCQFHYDSGEMSIDPAPKVYLQNRLARARTKIMELEAQRAPIRKESDQLSTRITSYLPDHMLGNIDELSDNYLDAQHQVTLFDTSQVALRSETDTITAAIGGDEGAQKPHHFKSSTFSIPTTCEYCKGTLWGVSKNGKTCKLCGISVHSKCELKIPADCQNATSVRGSSSLLAPPRSRPVRQVSTSSQSIAPSLASDDTGDILPTARMLFDFTATSAFELTASGGEDVKLLEPDDGSGWVKIVNEHGQDGLVPASYIEIASNASVSMPRPSLAPRNPARPAEYVRALYTYEAQGPDELGLVEGENILLTTGPNGGKAYGDGWWEGIDPRGRKGIFPSNYVETV